MAQLLNGTEVVAPTDADSAIARTSSRQLAGYMEGPNGLRLEVKSGTTGAELVLPPSGAAGVLPGATEMAGQPLHPDAASCRADVAASRRPDQCLSPHLVKLSDEGVIPSLQSWDSSASPAGKTC